MATCLAGHRKACRQHATSTLHSREAGNIKLDAHRSFDNALRSQGGKIDFEESRQVHRAATEVLTIQSLELRFRPDWRHLCCHDAQGTTGGARKNGSYFMLPQWRKEKKRKRKRKRKRKEKEKERGREKKKRRKEKKENAGAARSASVSGASSAGG